MKIASIEFAKHGKYFSNTRFIFVSVDPDRDTPEKLARYISYFESNFIGVTGDKAEIISLGHQFGILHKVTPNKKSLKYQVDHGGHIILINPKGEWQAILRYPHNSKKMIYDYSSIRGYIK